MKDGSLLLFVRYALRWYSEQFAIPFWMLGHIHLHFADYHDALEVGISLLLHVLVALGFWVGWQDYQQDHEEDG